MKCKRKRIRHGLRLRTEITLGFGCVGSLEPVSLTLDFTPIRKLVCFSVRNGNPSGIRYLSHAHDIFYLDHFIFSQIMWTLHDVN